MQKQQVKLQHIPIKVYRSADRLTIAAPMPGIQPEDLLIKVTENNSIILEGEIRGAFKDINETLIDEWNAGGYYREIPLPNPVDGPQANITYGNGVVVVSLPLSKQTIPAELTVPRVGTDKGGRTGRAGH